MSVFWLTKSISNLPKIVSELFAAFLNIYFYQSLTLDLSLLLAAVFARLSTPRIRNIFIIYFCPLLFFLPFCCCFSCQQSNIITNPRVKIFEIFYRKSHVARFSTTVCCLFFCVHIRSETFSQFVAHK